MKHPAKVKEYETMSRSELLGNAMDDYCDKLFASLSASKRHLLVMIVAGEARSIVQARRILLSRTDSRQDGSKITELRADGESWIAELQAEMDESLRWVSRYVSHMVDQPGELLVPTSSQGLVDFMRDYSMEKWMAEGTSPTTKDIFTSMATIPLRNSLSRSLRWLTGNPLTQQDSELFWDVRR